MTKLFFSWLTLYNHRHDSSQTKWQLSLQTVMATISLKIQTIRLEMTANWFARPAYHYMWPFTEKGHLSSPSTFFRKSKNCILGQKIVFPDFGWYESALISYLQIASGIVDGSRNCSNWVLSRILWRMLSVHFHKIIRYDRATR